MTAKPVHLLVEPTIRLAHQVPITLIPQLAAMSEAAGHPHAVGFEGVFAHRLGVERWKLTMPVNGLAIACWTARGRFADPTGGGQRRGDHSA